MTPSLHDGNGTEAEKPLVLVVDDVPDICDVIRVVLEERGSFRVSCAANSDEAATVATSPERQSSAARYDATMRMMNTAPGPATTPIAWLPTWLAAMSPTIIA